MFFVIVCFSPFKHLSVVCQLCGKIVKMASTVLTDTFHSPISLLKMAAACLLAVAILG